MGTSRLIGRFLAGILTSCLVACGSDSSGGNSGAGAAGGAGPATGGTGVGTGGSASSSGGTVSGSGGSPGAGGAAMGSGGATFASGGATVGAGGTAPGTGGANAACSQADTNGFFPTCTACIDPTDCDSINGLMACGCSASACPCGFRCGTYDLGGGITVSQVCVR